MSTEERREEYRQDRALEAEAEYQRDLWRWCTVTIARRWCSRTHGRGLYYGSCLCPQASRIVCCLLAAIDDVPDLGVLIRKANPDMMAFEESRMTPAQRYRFCCRAAARHRGEGGFSW